MQTGFIWSDEKTEMIENPAWKKKPCELKANVKKKITEKNIWLKCA